MTKRYITQKKLEDLKKELHYLKNVKRKEIAERLKQTSSFGDLSENFAYQETKEEQSFVEAKIKELEEILANTQVLKNNNSDKIEVGSTVVLKNINTNQKEKFQIVDPVEAEPSQNKISFNSPLGKELMGKTIGDKIRIKMPKGLWEYKIIEII